ncbi:MAG: hypothetical protein E7619_05370 [Ruminococcaceae bacterium]|nr:hypothetical protein [Oscillospiraceae bacterium]
MYRIFSISRYAMIFPMFLCIIISLFSMYACSGLLEPHDEGFGYTDAPDFTQKTNGISANNVTGLPNFQTNENGDTTTNPSEAGSLSEQIKAILLNAKSVSELHEGIRSIDENGEVADIKISQHLKGPEVSSGEISNDMVILLYYVNGSWVRCIRPNYVITSDEYTLYGEENIHGQLSSIVNSAYSVDELFRLLADYDSFGWIGEIMVYQNGDDLSVGKICITGKLAVGARVFVSVRTAYGSYIEWEFRKQY